MIRIIYRLHLQWTSPSVPLLFLFNALELCPTCSERCESATSNGSSRLSCVIDCSSRRELMSWHILYHSGGRAEILTLPGKPWTPGLFVSLSFSHCKSPLPVLKMLSNARNHSQAHRKTIESAHVWRKDDEPSSEGRHYPPQALIKTKERNKDIFHSVVVNCICKEGKLEFWK